MATNPIFINKRTGIQVEDGFEVRITNDVDLFTLDADQPVFKGKLPAGTMVAIDAKKSRPLLKRGIKFVYAVTDESYGYIPKFVINDFIFAQKFKECTGVSYGGDKWMVDGTGNAHAFPLSDGKHRCPICGKGANSHKLYENKNVQGICNDFVAYLGRETDLSWIITSAHSTRFKGSVMLGVLETAGGYIFAHSGTSGNPDRFANEVRSFCRERGLGKFFVAADLGDDNKFLVDKLGNDIGIGTIRELTKVVNFSVSDMWCAAPKLIQECYRRGLKPEAMSEKWSGSQHEKYADQDTIKSCDRCRKVVSFMLCGIS